MVGSASRKQRRSFESTAIAALAGISLASLAGQACGQTTVRYVGPNSGLWSEAINWNPAFVPANDGLNTYSVVLPAGKIVNFDLPDPTAITNASFEPGSRINLNSTSLDVDAVALLDNCFINAVGSGAEFQTHAPFATGQNIRGQAQNGGLISLGVSTYTLSYRDDAASPPLWADGLGSGVSLPSTTLIVAPGLNSQGASRSFSMRASNFGVLDLSAVTTMSGAGDDDWLEFRAESDGVVNLTSLQQITAGRVKLSHAGGAVLVPELSSAVGTTVYVAAGMTGQYPKLNSLTSGTIDIAPGGTMIAPLLTDVRGSYLYLTPSRSLSAPAFTQIDNARLLIAEGKTMEVAATGYTAAYRWDQGGAMMSADGVASVLDLSAMETMDLSGMWTAAGVVASYYMTASNTGALDLSGLITIRGAGGDDWLRFRAEGGGSIDLSQLYSVLNGGQVWFDLAEGLIQLPSLQAATQTKFSVATFQSLSLPQLTAATNGSFDIAPGGTVTAPLLTDVRGSYLFLTPSRFFNAPAFTQIDNARLFVAEGKTLQIAATAYTAAYRWDLSGTMMSADGATSLLDLSDLQTIDLSGMWTASGLIATYSMTGANSGTLDVSGVNIIKGPVGDDWLRFRAELGGTVLFTDVPHTLGRLWLDAANANSRIVVTGDLQLLGSPGLAAVHATTLGEFHVAGNFVHAIRNEADHQTKGGTLYMEGSGMQDFEVAGADLGVPDDVIPNNFDWGAMVIGRDDQPTTVMLVDTQDNFNRGPNGEPEVLYLSGFPQGIDGLSIMQESVLVLNGIQAYVGTVDGWVHLNSLFGPGVGRIPYGSGYVQLRWCPSDMNFDLNQDFFDVQQFLNYYSSGDLRADFVADGNLDFFDVQEFLNQYSAGCP